MLPVLGIFRRVASTMAGKYTSGDASMAFVTVPSLDVGKQLAIFFQGKTLVRITTTKKAYASGLVKRKLVACVNIIPGVTSVYEWENVVEEDGELLMMMKTMTSKMDEVSAYIRENHPYDVAEVISSKIDNGNPPYLQWISDVVNQGGQDQKCKP